MSSKPSPFTTFGASDPTQSTSDSPIQPPTYQNHSGYAGRSFGPGGIQSHEHFINFLCPSRSNLRIETFAPIQRAPSPSASQNPSPSVGQPYRPRGLQSSPAMNRTSPPVAFQNPSHSSGQSYRPGGTQRSPGPVNVHWGPEAFPRPIPSVRPYQFPGVQRSYNSSRKTEQGLAECYRPTLNPQFGHDESRNFQKDHSERSLATSSASTSHTLSRSGTDVVEIGRSQDSKRKSRSDVLPDRSLGVSRRNHSPGSGFGIGRLVDDFQQSSSQTWIRSPSSADNNPVRSRINPNRLIHQEQSPSSSFPYAHEAAEIQEATKRKSSAIAPSDSFLHNNPVFFQDDTRRSSTSPPGTKSFMLSRSSDSQFTGQSSSESNRDVLKGDALSDFESSEQPSLIVGLCPDMCPDSERGERERKGDLDHYERVDGDRNQTSKSLAVKKYTRTAEREAILIRPMPILQNTMEYLLSYRPYNENFLGMYNFLWDRMRAIRMDLRMQHIFNREAITLLEQMIRLHIIAMHELCEYTKGEGFSEGFDAHLNIEQMNKTSVELFQMYDDHRKRGTTIPTEKEFRGYYALLKLDKHPGYKVEPSELSLDLANMTPEIRQTSEVLFARSVARAGRTGNFIAFFRLARKASYLQACLMHAHFSKLRTHALTSLHAGLLNNQGRPVSDTSKWIGMEEEDIEALLEYHGFSIKVFEEPYMNHCGRCFCSIDRRRCFCSLSVVILADKANKGYQQETPPPQSLKKQTSLRLVDKVMTDSKTSLLLEEDKPVRTSVINPVRPSDVKPAVDQQNRNHFTPAGEFHSPGFPQAESLNLKKQPNGGHTSTSPAEIKFPFAEHMQTNLVPGSILQQSPFAVHMQTNLVHGPTLQQSPKSMPMESVPVTTISESPARVENISALEESVPEAAMTVTLEEGFDDIEQEDEDGHEDITSQYEEEVAKAKLKLIIRLWKRWSSRQSELRERRQLAAAAALNSLTLGTPIRLSKTDRACGEFDIDQAMKRRFEEREKSWSRLNISDVVADILVERNPDSKCIWWKVILCLHDIDKSKIASFTVVSIANNSQKGHEVRFFSDSRLRGGLKWLAGNSPPQPNLHHVKPRELVLTHFSFSLELLKKMLDQEVGPNICISAFNDALETSKRNIASAAEANPIGWPGPETMLLDNNKKEHLMAKRYLPNVDWSSAESIEQLNSVLENCKLPYFEDDLTWLTLGCASGAEIEKHTQRLEGCLVEYLTQTSNLMGDSLASKEAGVMLQRNTTLELHNSSYYHIIPRWIGIFQRIFNWRIMDVLDSSSSSAYVQKSDLAISASSYADKFLSEDASYQSSRPKQWSKSAAPP
ncbi:hypothetical protein DY000_02051327 [Brassica cretica]|uniref:PCI domain-containing protein n=1 Tax=Brassica cretica TaxID=69181 RepID=A0ABQ7F2T5_BRACR|nr:hypothetical protein DY000_02051327 [Brassica cretica]